MSTLDQLKQIQTSAISKIYAIRYDWYVLVGLLWLSIIGVAITDAFETMSHWYWLAMVPVSL